MIRWLSTFSAAIACHSSTVSLGTGPRTAMQVPLSPTAIPWKRAWMPARPPMAATARGPCW